MSSGSGSFAHVCLHVSHDWSVRCSTYPHTTPILSFNAGSSAVSVTTPGNHADEKAVGFAQALAREAQRFADEMERMHAAQLADAHETNKVAEHDAA